MPGRIPLTTDLDGSTADELDGPGTQVDLEANPAPCGFRPVRRTGSADDVVQVAERCRVERAESAAEVAQVEAAERSKSSRWRTRSIEIEIEIEIEIGRGRGRDVDVDAAADSDDEADSVDEAGAATKPTVRRTTPGSRSSAETPVAGRCARAGVLRSTSCSPTTRRQAIDEHLGRNLRRVDARSRRHRLSGRPADRPRRPRSGQGQAAGRAVGVRHQQRVPAAGRGRRSP